jgi:hypothetical protein
LILFYIRSKQILKEMDSDESIRAVNQAHGMTQFKSALFDEPTTAFYDETAPLPEVEGYAGAKTYFRDPGYTVAMQPLDRRVTTDGSALEAATYRGERIDGVDEQQQQQQQQQQSTSTSTVEGDGYRGVCIDGDNADSVEVGRYRGQTAAPARKPESARYRGQTTPPALTTGNGGYHGLKHKPTEELATYRGERIEGDADDDDEAQGYLGERDEPTPYAYVGLPAQDDGSGEDTYDELELRKESTYDEEAITDPNLGKFFSFHLSLSQV